MESLDALLCGDGSESLKGLCLRMLLCLVTVRLFLLLLRMVTTTGHDNNRQSRAMAAVFSITAIVVF